MFLSLNVSVSTSQVWFVTWTQKSDKSVCLNTLYLTWSQASAGAPCFTDLSYSLPVARHHSFVSHELQQRTALAEFIDGLLQVQEGLPLLQRPRQLATSFSLKGALVNAFKAKSLFLNRYIFMLTRICEVPFSNQSKFKYFTCRKLIQQFGLSKSQKKLKPLFE